MKVIKTNIKAETVEINPREAEALRNTFQDNRRTYNDNIRKYAKQYDLDTGEVSYCEVRQSIVRLHSTLAIEDSHAHLNNSGY